MSYLKIRALAAPAVLLITVSEGAFRGYCDTRTPLIASLTAAIVNVIFDPILMFKPLKMGVSGAAAATAGSQISAMLVYLNVIHKRKMVRYSLSSSPVKHQQIKNKRRKVIYTILRANVSMLMKQFSLLVAWSYATSRATSIGHVHVAAHQITLSLWLLFALVQDGLAVAAQVLMSRTTSLHSKRSLTFYMVKASVLQSILCSLIIYLLRGFLPVFSKDSRVLEKLQLLMPVLIAFQPLVSATLVMESIVVGGNCFVLLAFGTFVATVGSMVILRKAESVVSIWMYGLTSLFIGRFIVAIIGVLYLNGLRWPKSWKRKNIQQPIPPPIDFDSQT
jgi:putative MATE family efflux protein